MALGLRSEATLRVTPWPFSLHLLVADPPFHLRHAAAVCSGDPVQGDLVGGELRPVLRGQKRGRDSALLHLHRGGHSRLVNPRQPRNDIQHKEYLKQIHKDGRASEQGARKEPVPSLLDPMGGSHLLDAL